MVAGTFGKFLKNDLPKLKSDVTQNMSLSAANIVNLKNIEEENLTQRVMDIEKFNLDSRLSEIEALDIPIMLNELEAETVVNNNNNNTADDANINIVKFT